MSNNGFNYALDARFTNDDVGVYNRAEAAIFSFLFQDLFALGNSSASSMADMVNNGSSATGKLTGAQ